MKLDEALLIIGVCVLMVSFTYAVIDAATYVPVPKDPPYKMHLPTKCREFYDTGTDEWCECMQVGRK